MKRKEKEKRINMKKRFRLVLSLLVLCLLFSLTGCGKSETKTTNKPLLVGTNAEFPPFEYINNDGKEDGFDIALIKAIGNEMGYDVTIKNMEFKSLIASITTGGLDASIAGMTITEDRKQSVDFSDAYYTATQYIIVPIDSKITSCTFLYSDVLAI